MKRFIKPIILTTATILFLGGAYTCATLYRQAHQKPVQLTAATFQETSIPKTAIAGEPSHLSIPGVNIAVTVTPGYYNPKTKDWTDSPTTAVFATTSAKPNNLTGNTYIYGHNRPNMFTRLLKAKLGTTAQVTTSNGHVFRYQLISVHDVAANDVSVIQPSKDPTLSLQTCSGIFYQNRRIFVFRLIGAV